MRPLALLVLSALAPLPAQESAANPFGHSRHGETFDEGPRQAAYLLQGMSPQVHVPVVGVSAQAQAFFDQGVTQLHGFWYFEAERSFRQVALLHPACAMAYWGMAMANVENGERATGFIANAVERSASVPRYEQLWIDAWASYYVIDDSSRKELQSGDATRVAQAKAALVKRAKAREAAKGDDARKSTEQRDRQLIKDLGTLVYEFPDDIEAKAFLALQIWLAYAWGGGIGIVSHTAVDSLLDQVFAKAPLHPAHHYRVHLWDQEKAERAVKSAAILGHTAPGIAHEWHMGGHIFDKLKRFEDAAWQQEASSRVDHAHMLRDHVMPFLIHNYGHNQEWLCRSLQNLGRVHEALDLAKNIVELPRHPKKNRVDQDGEIADYGRKRLLEVCRTFELWDELRAACDNGLIDVTGRARADGERLLHLGIAAYRMGDLVAGAQAQAGLDDVLALAKRQRAEAVDKAEEEALARNGDAREHKQATDEAVAKGTEPVRAVRDMIAWLRAEQALALGDGEAALAACKDVARVPPDVRAQAHTLAGESAKAIEVLQREADDKQNRVPPLVRLVLALHAGGERDRAKAAFESLRSVAGRADLDVPLLQRLAPVAADLDLPADWRQARPPAADARVDERPPLDQLGPFRWTPQPAPGFDLADADGVRHRFEVGRPTLVVFYLGFGCLHCVEQLQALRPRARAFADAGIDIVAIGTDSAADAAAALADLDPDERFSFPLLADPQLATFKAWRCHDDFEGLPLHGTFLVGADGNVRWQDISFEPFTDIDWLLGESRRLLGLPSGGVGSK